MLVNQRNRAVDIDTKYVSRYGNLQVLRVKVAFELSISKPKSIPQMSLVGQNVQISLPRQVGPSSEIGFQNETPLNKNILSKQHGRSVKTTFSLD